VTDLPRAERKAFSESEGQRILSRAAELELTEDTRYTSEELRQIAMEAGIGSRALDAALLESLPRADAAVGSGPRSWPVSEVIMALLGVGAGALALLLDGGFGSRDAAVVGAGLTAVITLFSTMRHRPKGNLGGFVRDSIALFGGGLLATMGLDGYLGPAPSLIWGTFCTALGAAIVTALPPASDRAQV
jgi:hypothetical protein